MLEKLLSPLVVGVGSRALSQIISFSLVVIASRYLDLTGFGTFSLAWGATVVAVSFVFSGFYHAILRSKDLDRDADTLFWMMLVIGVIGSAVMVCIGLFGVSGELSRAFLWLSIVPTVVVLVAWNEALLLAGQRARAASIHHATSETVGIIVVYFALEAGFGIMGLVAGRLAATAAGLTMTTAMVRRVPKFRLETAGFRRVFETALPLWASTGVSMFGNYGSDFILGAFLSPAAVGAYRGGSRIAATASDVVTQPLAMLNWAKFSRLERAGEIPALRKAWHTHAAFSMALTWPILASVAILAPQLTLILFGEDWLPAAPIITLLAAAKALGLFLQLMTPTLSCMDRGALQVKLRAAGAGLLLVLLLITGSIGAEAVAVAHIITNLVMAVACIWAMSITLGIPWQKMLRSFVPGLMLSAVCAMGILLFSGHLMSLGDEMGLALTVGLLAMVWIAATGVMLKARVLALPTP